MIVTAAASQTPNANRFAVIRIVALSIAQFHFALIVCLHEISYAHRYATGFAEVRKMLPEINKERVERYFSLHFGLRFSRNEATPSRKSSVDRISEFARIAASIS